MVAYTPQTRHDWLKDNLTRIDKQELSYRDMALELKAQFGLDRPPSPATIGRSLKEVREEGLQPYTEEAMRLLEPENFPEFRRLFPAPNGSPYETNRTHHALYWVMYALTRKKDLPLWVIEYWELPEDINTDIIEKEKLLTFILMMAPRHGKTMTILHGLIALICENPNVRILYGQGVKETSEKAMGLIMSEMEYNEKLRELYGPFRDDDRKWSYKNGFIAARRTIQSITDTFTPMGINSNVRSLDADIIIIDDPQDLDRAESEAITTRDYRKITTEIMTRREAHTPVLMIGSHLPTLFGDVFTQLEDNIEDLNTEGQAILMRKRPAHDLLKCGGGPEHIQCIEWPEYRDWNFLEAQRAMLKDEMYEAVYQQVSRAPGTRPFPPEIVKANRPIGILDPTRSWKVEMPACPREGCGGALYNTLGFDPAAGETRRASYSALHVLQGCIKCRTLYEIDYWAKRQSPELHAQTIIDYAKAFNVGWVKVEANAYQKALARDNILREGARNVHFNIDEHMTDDKKNTATFGIPNLARYMRDDKFSVPAKTDIDMTYGKELRDSLIRYPQRPDDIPLSLWLSATMMWEVWDLYASPEPLRVAHLEEAVPQYMIDQPLRVNLALVVNDG